MAYEDILIQESTGEGGGWSLDRTEATCDWYDHLACVPPDSDEDVSEAEKLPASSESTPLDYDHFGSESEPYTREEAEQRREWLREAYLDQGHLNT